MENLRGAALMTLAMLGFAGEDTFIKLMSAFLPTWQIMALLGAGASVVFAGLTVVQRQSLMSRSFLHPMVLLRNLGEIVGTLGFVTAIALAPISAVSAVLQATPLAVTLGAAVVLREPVGWRRWSAIWVGFFGVLLVIAPWDAGFDWSVLYALVGVIGLTIRDLATRRVSDDVSSIQLSFLAFLTLIPASIVLSAFSPRAYVPMDPGLWTMLGASVCLGAGAYYAIVAAMRVGDVSFVTPFRYSRMIFALIVGVTVFGERPDMIMLLGAVIIIASGMYTVWRERKHRTAA